MFFIVVTHVISVDSWDNLKMWKAQLLKWIDTSQPCWSNLFNQHVFENMSSLLLNYNKS